MSTYFLLIFLSINFQNFQGQAVQDTELKFFIISCDHCEAVIERVEILLNAYPKANVVFNSIEEEINVRRFKMISDLVDQVLEMPVVGIFNNGVLWAIGSGGLDSENWRKIIDGKGTSLVVYIADRRGGIEKRIEITEQVEISNLEAIFEKSPDYVDFMSSDILPLISIVTVAAVIDAFNPCCFSVFVILLTLVFYSVGKKAVLKVGLAFIAAIFLAYFSLGLGLSAIFPHFMQVKYIVAALALIIGGLRIVEALGKKVKHVPDVFAGVISNRLDRASSPKTGFLAGMAVGFLMLPCSSGPYFLVLSLLTERARLTEGLLLMGLYNLIIILPFMLITLVVYALLRTTLELKLWSLENRRWINFSIGVVLIALSVFILIF